MNRFLGILVFVATIAAIDYGIWKGMSESSPAPSVILYPTNGAVVKGTITLEAIPINFTSQIVKVVFYRDGIPFYTNYNPQPLAVTNLQVKK